MKRLGGRSEEEGSRNQAGFQEDGDDDDDDVAESNFPLRNPACTRVALLLCSPSAGSFSVSSIAFYTRPRGRTRERNPFHPLESSSSFRAHSRVSLLLPAGRRRLEQTTRVSYLCTSSRIYTGIPTSFWLSIKCFKTPADFYDVGRKKNIFFSQRARMELLRVSRSRIFIDSFTHHSIFSLSLSLLFGHIFALISSYSFANV